MSRKNRTTLPPVTEQDIAQHPEMLRRTPRGWAWKCHHCSQFASSETVAGSYVCRHHGGNTPRQRDPVLRERAVREGRPAPRPPGRPLSSGLYSKREHVRVDQVVLEYQARKIDPDTTDDNMLALRAYLQLRMDERPDLSRLSAPLQDLGLQTQTVSECLGDGDPTVDGLMDLLVGSRTLRVSCETTLGLLKRTVGSVQEIERGHARLIALSRVRADTRLKDGPARDLEFFYILLNNLLGILMEWTTPEVFAALEKRLERELSDVPRATLDGSASFRK